MAQLLSIIALSVLIVLCIVFFVFLFLRGGVGAKIFFCIYSSLCVLFCVGVGLIWDRDSAWFFERIVNLGSSVPVAALVITLECVAIITLVAATTLLKFRRKQPTEKKVETEIVESEDIILPDNCRKADERKHGDYKIVRMG